MLQLPTVVAELKWCRPGDGPCKTFSGVEKLEQHNGPKFLLRM